MCTYSCIENWKSLCHKHVKWKHLCSLKWEGKWEEQYSKIRYCLKTDLLTGLSCYTLGNEFCSFKVKYKGFLEKKLANTWITASNSMTTATLLAGYFQVLIFKLLILLEKSWNMNNMNNIWIYFWQNCDFIFKIEHVCQLL